MVLTTTSRTTTTTRPVSSSSRAPASGRTSQPYKTSVVCRILKDQPGALLLILQEFAHRYINLTKIESRPSKRGLGDYIFFVDMEGSIDDVRVSDALRCLACKLLEVKVLGSYPVGRPPLRADKF